MRIYKFNVFQCIIQILSDYDSANEAANLIQDREQRDWPCHFLSVPISGAVQPGPDREGLCAERPAAGPDRGRVKTGISIWRQALSFLPDVTRKLGAHTLIAATSGSTPRIAITRFRL